MKGFKSFANKTEIVFGPGFNCVLGPNGSGKSNVLDALCFVLGKSSAKGLRAEKSANLIYNGGKKKEPAKEGLVSIVFDNENKVFGDFPELVITRIVAQSGASKYKINGKTAQRQDILDTLSRDRIDPDGYNIILQGDINQLIEMSTEARRGIVEEIAGISVYEDKKEKALRELTRVEEKLGAADIVLAERKTYLRELKKERDQAQKFKELDEKIKRNKATLLTLRKAGKTTALKELEKRVEKGSDELKKLREKQAALEQEIAERRAEIESINKEVERRGEKEQVALHKEVEGLKVELAVNKQRIETLQGELAKLDDRKEELTRTNAELLAKIKGVETERKEREKRIAAREEQVKKLDERLAEFRKKHNVEDASKIDAQVEEIDRTAEKVQEEIAKLREEQQSLLREKDKSEIRLEQIDQKITRVAEIAKESKKELEGLKNKKESFKKATKELSTALNEDSSLAAQLNTARSKLLSRKEELAKLQGQRSSIMERVAGGAAISKILELKSKGEIKGIHGTVSGLGKVKQEFALALEVAAGPRINSIVVDTDEVAARCISYLRENRLGVATFLPLNKLRPSESEPPAMKKDGSVLGLAQELVEYDAAYAKVFRYVFGSTLVVDTIDSARRIGVGKVRMVTLKGDLVETSGAMQGGYRDTQRQGISFAQKETSERIERNEAEVADLEGMLEKLEQKRSDNEELITRLRELKAELEGEIIKTEKSLHLDSEDAGLDGTEKKRLQDDVKRLEGKLDSAVNAVSEQTMKLGKLKVEKQQLRDRISALRSPAVLAEMNTFEEKKQQLKAEIAELQGEMRSSESEVKNILMPETEKVANILKQQEKERKAFTDEKSSLEKRCKDQDGMLTQKEAAEKKFFSQFKELFTKRQKLQDHITEKEGLIRDGQRREREIEGKSIGVSLEIARLRAELAGVEEELKRYDGAEPYKSHEKSEEDIQLEVREFERLVQDIGAVNMKALQIYEQVEHEYNELVIKKKRLGEEREDVLLMINEIDSKKKELFVKTFDVVNENFQHFFTQLSRKGEAFLELEDTNDPFAGGLTIKVRLTGKKFLDIRSLSGGEKTMTALAFLFSVQEHEPASFYVMDEVDAALDKHNSELLSKLIRKYCSRAQYVIISHNDAVITEADTLYGISMDEHGMSKVTSLKI
jgi:chromosome segregation protein